MGLWIIRRESDNLFTQSDPFLIKTYFGCGIGFTKEVILFQILREQFFCFEIIGIVGDQSTRDFQGAR